MIAIMSEVYSKLINKFSQLIYQLLNIKLVNNNNVGFWLRIPWHLSQVANGSLTNQLFDFMGRFNEPWSNLINKPVLFINELNINWRVKSTGKGGLMMNALNQLVHHWSSTMIAEQVNNMVVNINQVIPSHETLRLTNFFIHIVPVHC